MSRDKTRPDEYDEDWEEENLVQNNFHVPTARTSHPTGTRRSYEPPSSSRRRQPRRRRIWPWLLLGCGGGIVLLVLAAAVVVLVAIRSATGGSIAGIPGIPGLPNPTTYRQQSSQTLTISSLGLLQVQDQIGNVTITADPHATTATLTTIKIARVASSSAANAEFNKIAVQVQPIGSGLTINATVPDSGGILGTHTDSVDLTLTLPQNAISSASGTPPALSVNMSIGNITINNIGGLLTLKDDVGNITVQQSVLYDGSHLETGTGNVTYSGSINTTPANGGNTAPLYKLQSETGNVTATLPANTSVILDANTNLGKISSAFPIHVTNSDGAANYYGPLLANATPTPQATLTLDVSTGNVNIQQR
jgi:hypothetical protein